MTSATAFEPATVNVRIKILALWTSTLFVFAYVDIFGFFRSDMQADIAAGKLSVGFTINQAFLLGTTLYIAIPSLMVFLTLIMQPQANRMVNLVLCVVYSLTIVGGAIGEWSYYIVGSALEVVLLAAIAFYAWTWPKKPSNAIGT
jgi:hypothetical protein